jgi:hypothetical protein
MDYVKSKQFPDYLEDKIRYLLPLLDRPLTESELTTIINSILKTLGQICFALYIADKVFNYRHRDFNYRNCVIKPDGTPVIVDFGSNKFFSNNNIARRTANQNNSGKNFVKYKNDIFDPMQYIEAIQPYIRQIRNSEKLSNLINYRTKTQENIQPIVLTKISTLIESALTNTPEAEFDYQRTFRTLGVPQQYIDVGAQKIRDRVVIVSQENNLESQMDVLRQMGFSNDLIRSAITAHPGNPNAQVNWIFSHM